MSVLKVCIIALTEQGLILANRLNSLVENSEVLYKPKPFTQTVQEHFKQGHRLIFISATGIVVRTLAPVLQDKYKDPAVLVLDEQGEFVIPLLSGHEGGANDFAATIANKINAKLVQTTAKAYVKPIYTIGLGCERNCPISFVQSLITQALFDANLELSQIKSINSIDIKADEQAFMALSTLLNIPFNTFDVPTLQTVEDQLSIKSDYIFQTVGVYGVAESSALCGASKITGNESELVLNKIKNTKATVAIARSYP
ncbi:cobalamin biosynthesis protein [Marinicellulosiphila megalodicopiae]|uniref:cobalamin biosynthesis protein n=1 Tax=Marinicellulosiphila megalodicopiae TaxID=2724896 RepID=UPI003BAEB731